LRECGVRFGVLSNLGWKKETMRQVVGRWKVKINKSKAKRRAGVPD
jgi:hypothetical protein